MAKNRATVLDSVQFTVFQHSFLPLTVTVERIQRMLQKQGVGLILEASFAERKKTKFSPEELMFRIELRAADKSGRESAAAE